MKITVVLVAILLSLSSFAQPWSVNPADYEFTMSVTGQVKINGSIVNSDSAYIGAFVDDECRGYVKATESNGEYKNYLLTIYSNISSGEDINFKWVDEQGQEYAIANTMKFYTDSIICSADYPFVFMDQEDYASTDFLSFSVDSQVTAATINASAKTINLLVKNNTDLTTLIPKFTLAPAAAAYIDNVLQVSEQTQNDFTDEVVYNVKGIDGTEANWTVTIKHEEDYVYDINNKLIKIYPNPATNYINISGIDNFERLQIFNLQGKLIIDKKSFTNKMNIGCLLPGKYLIKLTTKNYVVIKKLIVR